MVNGEPTADGLVAAQMDAVHGRPTILRLQYEAGAVRIAGQGVIEVASTPANLGNVVRNMDPKGVEEEALSGLGWDDDHGLAYNIMQVIARRLDEAAGSV